VCGHINIAHPFFVSIYLSIFLSLKQEHLLFVCLFQRETKQADFFFKENLLC
jgi:hypothetical protein